MGTQRTKVKGRIDGNILRLWGLIFVIAGIVGRGVIQAHILGVNGAGSQELLDILSTKPNAMSYAALSIALQAAETCAVPIFQLSGTQRDPIQYGVWCKISASRK